MMAGHAARARRTRRIAGFLFLILIASAPVNRLFSPAPALALQSVFTIGADNCGQQDRELKSREEALKASEQRLNALKKDLNQRISTYENLLAKVQDALKELKAASGGNISRLVTVYEAMPPQSTADAVSGLDLETAVRIMLKMQPRKAAKVMARMSPAKVAQISSAMLGMGKKIPGR